MNIITLILAHFILDYPLQGDFLATTKGKYFYSLLAHSIIYGLGMSVALNLTGTFEVWKAVVLVVSHIIIDYKKATAKNTDKALTSYLYIDQALHMAINFVLYLV